MSQIALLKRVCGVELWTMVSGAAEHFVVKSSDRRARVMHTLESAEAFFAAQLLHVRSVRAH